MRTLSALTTPVKSFLGRICDFARNTVTKTRQGRQQSSGISSAGSSAYRNSHDAKKASDEAAKQAAQERILEGVRTAGVFCGHHIKIF
jgi:hypothetical protein